MDGTGSAAGFAYPTSIAVDSSSNVYVADEDVIKKGIPTSSVPPPVLQLPSLITGQCGFGITGLPGLVLYIDSSSDLAQWQEIGTYILVAGTNYFVSPTPPQSIQFYRGRVR